MTEQQEARPKSPGVEDSSSDPEMAGRQPYRWPRNPEDHSPQEKRQRTAWMAAGIIAVTAVLVLVVFIAEWR